VLYVQTTSAATMGTGRTGVTNSTSNNHLLATTPLSPTSANHLKVTPSPNTPHSQRSLHSPLSISMVTAAAAAEAESSPATYSPITGLPSNRRLQTVPVSKVAQKPQAFVACQLNHVFALIQANNDYWRPKQIPLCGHHHSGFALVLELVLFMLLSVMTVSVWLCSLEPCHGTPCTVLCEVARYAPIPYALVYLLILIPVAYNLWHWDDALKFSLVSKLSITDGVAFVDGTFADLGSVFHTYIRDGRVLVNGFGGDNENGLAYGDTRRKFRFTMYNTRWLVVRLYLPTLFALLQILLSVVAFITVNVNYIAYIENFSHVWSMVVGLLLILDAFFAWILLMGSIGSFTPWR